MASNSWVGAASVNESNILEITHILSILTATELEKYGPDESPDVELRHYEMADEEDADLLKDIDRECDWIDGSLNHRTKDGRKGAIIIHCQQGISRSAAVAVAYCESISQAVCRLTDFDSDAEV